MMYQAILWWATLFLRIYFRRTIVFGAEHIPENGPLIVAANHPSSFMEASLLATVLGRPLYFLVRGDVFNPRFMWLFRWTNQIPIFRQKDGIANLRKNASSFDLTYRKLAEGNAVLIFPEAKTELQKKLRPVQRGTAHLAFGTTPFLAPDQEIWVLPVGVNFTEPRLPGTDVVVRFGKPFIAEKATRDDRMAIDRFTGDLGEAMNPLVLQVEDHGYERHYDVLASVYFHFAGKKRIRSSSFDDLAAIAAMTNHHEKHHDLLSEVHAHIHMLKKHKLVSAVYFPELLVRPKILLGLSGLVKIAWLILGGWVWRLLRSVIFSKIKAVTFQGPVSLGAAMVVYLLATLVFLSLCLAAGWPLWLVPLWLIIMWLGVLVFPPLDALIGVMFLPGKIKRELREGIFRFREKLTVDNFGVGEHRSKI